MARINIEDSLFKDPRFMKLMIKVWDRHKALGMVTDAYILAQQHYLNEESGRLIPLESWAHSELGDALILCGLAVAEKEGIYVCGSEKQFKWLLQRQNAGRQGGKKTQENRARKRPSSDRQAKPSKGLTTANGSQASYSISISKKNITSPNGDESETSDPPSPVMKKAARKHHWLADVWNENRGSLPACRTPLSSQRANSVKLRCKEEPDPKVWVEVVRKLAASDFCNGKNDRRWVADFSFLIKPNTREVTLEGRYDNRSTASSGVRSISSILEDHANV